MLSSKVVLAAVCTLAVLGTSSAWNCLDTSVTWTGSPTPQLPPPTTNSTTSKNYCYKIGASSGSGADQKNMILWSGSDVWPCGTPSGVLYTNWIGTLAGYDNIDYACCKEADKCNLGLTVTVASAMVQPSLLLLLSVLAAMMARSLLL